MNILRDMGLTGGGGVNLDGRQVINVTASLTEPDPQNVGDVWIETDRSMRFILSLTEPETGSENDILLLYKFGRSILTTTNGAEFMNDPTNEIIYDFHDDAIKSGVTEDSVLIWENPYMKVYGELFKVKEWSVKENKWVNIEYKVWDGASWKTIKPEVDAIFSTNALNPDTYTSYTPFGYVNRLTRDGEIKWKTFATNSRPSVRVNPIKEEIYVFRHYDSELEILDFDGNIIRSGIVDRDLSGGVEQPDFKLARDGNFLFLSSGRLRLYDYDTLETIYTFGTDVSNFAVNHVGEVLVNENDRYIYLELHTEGESGWSRENYTRDYVTVQDMEITKDGNYYYLIDNNRIIHSHLDLPLSDTISGKVITSDLPKILEMNNERIAVASDDELVVLDLETNEIWRRDLTPYQISSYPYLEGMAITENNTVYVMLYDRVIIFNKDGEELYYYYDPNDGNDTRAGGGIDPMHGNLNVFG